MKETFTNMEVFNLLQKIYMKGAAIRDEHSEKFLDIKETLKATGCCEILNIILDEQYKLLVGEEIANDVNLQVK